MAEETQSQIPRGFVLSDSNKKEWIIGSFIGIDGSAENYEAAEYKGKIPIDYPVLIKLRPSNDAQFTLEVNFYKQHANPIEIHKLVASQNVHCYYLGLPRYLGFGENVKIRCTYFNFLALDRYGSGLQTLLVQHKNLFPKSTVLKIAYQIVCVLEYLHQRDIVHGDVRASNLCLEWHSNRRTYLLPKFHAADESDQDAMVFWSEFQHCGSTTKIGDFESLLYNVIDWSGGILPWKNVLPEKAKDMKIQAFENPKQFFQDAFPSCECEDFSVCLRARKCTASGKPVAPFKCMQAIADLMEQVAVMKKSDECRPNYEAIKEALRKRLLNMYHVPMSKLEFSIPTVIGDEDNGIPHWPGSGIAVEILAIIIAENCSTFDEVDAFDKKPSGVVDVISEILMKKTNTMSSSEASGIRKAWRRDLSGLRSSVINQWRLKGIEPGDYERWKENKDSQEEAKRGEKRASLEVKKKATKRTDYDSPGASINKENCSGPMASKNESHLVNADSTNDCSPLQPRTQRKRSTASSGYNSPAKLSLLGSPPESIVFPTSLGVRLTSPPKSTIVQNPTLIHSKDSSNRRSSQNVLYSEDSSSSQTSGWSSDRLSAETEIVLPHCYVKVVSLEHQRVPKEVVPKTTEVAETTDEQVNGQREPVPANCKPWHKTYEWLNAWFGVREKMLKSLGPISPEPEKLAEQVQELVVLRDEFGMQQPRLRHLVNVLAKLPSDSVDAQKISQIEIRWLKQLVWLEERGQELGDANMSQACRDNKILLQDNEILIWLIKEVDNILEKFFISTDYATLQQQCKQSQVVCRLVMSKDTEVMKLLNERRDTLSRSLEDTTFQQLFFDIIQRRWNRLKKKCLDIHNNLQNIKKYWQTHNSFLDWLSKIRNKFESLKPISLNAIKEVLQELSLINEEAREKADEFAEIAKLRNIYVGVCDQDKGDQVKDEFNAMKERWDKLNADLLKGTQHLESISELIVSFNKNLHCLQQKIEQCEAGLAAYNASGETAEDSTLSDCSKEVQKEIVLLQRSYDIVCQEAKNLLSKTHEQSIDASYLLKEMKRVAIRVKSLNFNVSESTIKILKQQCVVLTTELEQAENYNNTILETIEKKKALTSKIKRRLSNITDLEKIVQTVEEGLGFPINAGAVRQQVELLSQEINRLDTHDNGLKKALKTRKHSSNVDELIQKPKKK